MGTDPSSWTPHTAFWIYWSRRWALCHVSKKPFLCSCAGYNQHNSWRLELPACDFPRLKLEACDCTHFVIRITEASQVLLDCYPYYRPRVPQPWEDSWELRYHCLALPHSSATRSNTPLLVHSRFSFTGPGGRLPGGTSTFVPGFKLWENG